MFTSIDDLILDRAAAMAGHDGGHASAALIIGAAAQLQAELITARDRLLNVAAGSAHAGAGAMPTEAPEVEAAAPAAPEVEEPTTPAAPAVEPAPAPAIALTKAPAAAPAAAPQDAAS